MKLIKEYVEKVQLIVEGTTKDKDYFIEGIFLQSDLKNRNGRVYPSNILDKEVDRYTKEYIDKNRAYGELGHPDNPSINLDRVSHMIKSLTKEGKNYIGKAKIIDTPHGKIVKSLINEGAALGVSSRGLGSLVVKDGVNIVQDDFMLATAADIVADPSAPDAFVEGIMESAEWAFNASTKSWQTAEIIQSKLKKMSLTEIEQRKLELFKQFLKEL
jgi:hypothetical protein